jgi:hypothetical protein
MSEALQEKLHELRHRLDGMMPDFNSDNFDLFKFTENFKHETFMFKTHTWFEMGSIWLASRMEVRGGGGRYVFRPIDPVGMFLVQDRFLEPLFPPPPPAVLRQLTAEQIDDIIQEASVEFNGAFELLIALCVPEQSGEDVDLIRARVREWCEGNEAN